MENREEIETSITQAAAVTRDAGALLICTGAGMGVDSGLPDFRGNEGFWKAYPPFARLGLSFIDMANPGWFHQDPELAWGFYGHRLNLSRQTIPHKGFERLLRLLKWGHVKVLFIIHHSSFIIRHFLVDILEPAVRKPQLQSVFFHFPVFSGKQTPVDFRISAGVIGGKILTHQA